jgi:enoyl-CoA hydratase
MFNATGIVNGLTSTEMGISYLLPRLIGAAHSNDILLTGRTIDSTSAYRIGLVSRVVADDKLLGAAIDVAVSMTRFSPYGLQYSKEACRVGLEIGSLDAAIEFEDRNQLMLGFTDNLPEAIRAFDAGREPVYLDEPRRDIWGSGPS